MRHFCLFVFLSVGLIVVGCGKSDEQKKMETDLNEQISKGHHAQMAKLADVDEMIDSVEASLARYDSLAAAHQKEVAQQPKSDLISARDRLTSSREAMESWMAAYRPYNEGIKHDQAMAEMKTEFDALQQVAVETDSALADASRSVHAHEAPVASSKTGIPTHHH